MVCGDPDAAGRLAERLGGHPAEDDGRAPSGRCWAGCALDELPLDAARAAVLVQDKDPVLLSGTLRDLLDVPASGAVAAEEALAAAQCGDVLDGAGAGVGATARGPDGRPDHRARPLAVRRPAAAAGAGPFAGHRPGGAGAGRADLGRRLAHRGTDRGGRCGSCGRAGRPSCSPPRPLLLDRADRVVFVHEGEVGGGGRPPRTAAHRPRVPRGGHPRAGPTAESRPTAGVGDDGRDGLTELDALEEIEETA